MLDKFVIFNKGGSVLWSWTWAAVTGSPVNDLVKKILLEERTAEAYLDVGSYRLKWTLDNRTDLVFAMVYQKIVTVPYANALLNDVRDAFIHFQGGESAVKSLVIDKAFLADVKDFRVSFDALLEVHEEASRPQAVQKATPLVPTGSSSFSSSSTTVTSSSTGAENNNNNNNGNNNGNGNSSITTPSSSNPTSPSTSTPGSPVPGASPVGPSPVKGRKPRTFDKSRKANKLAKERGAVINSPVKSGAEDKAQADAPPSTASLSALDKLRMKGIVGRGGKTGGKKAVAAGPTPVRTKKMAESTKLTGSQKKELNVSGELASERVLSDAERAAMIGSSNLDLDDWGKFGEDDEDEFVAVGEDSTASAQNGAAASKSSGGLFSMFKGLVGERTLTREDLQPVLDEFKDKLVKKNVAEEIAEKITDSVVTNLEGKTMSTFQRTVTTVREALDEAIEHILTPVRKIEIDRDIRRAKAEGRPYVIVFCGVNGVGKSTTLAKICFWLKSNKHSVLIAACDTFRSGAVEQLKVHSSCLDVPLYDRGYGKDAAGIAAEAIKEAKDEGINVVLVDTAGRMQDNMPLMQALSKLVVVNKPDNVFFVGEALVGNDGVDQLIKFNEAMTLGTKAQDAQRSIDGIVLTKFDTIDDKVGAALSMTYASGLPIVFVGVGQTYTDLKRMNVNAVIQALLK